MVKVRFTGVGWLVVGLALQFVVMEAQAAKRVALVIGNSAYQTAPLKNPVNDASDMAKTLTDLGFEVQHHNNLNRKNMAKAVRRFGKALKDAEVGLFYFAGHGMEVKNRNYLIPLNADITDEDEVEFEAIDAASVLAKMESAGNPVNILILDACRNNPLERSFRSASRGLARMDAPVGTFLLYATAPGQVAADGKGRNGLFTHHFLQNIKKPGLSLREVALQTRVGVMQETHRKQIPWESSSLTQTVTLLEAKLQPEPIRPSVEARTGRLTVKVEPDDAKIRIMNIGPRYQAGMALEKGQSYDIYVTRDGYKPYRESVVLTQANQVVGVVLDKQVGVVAPVTPPTSREWFEPEMVNITGGSFRMGDLSGEGDDDEKPVHTVKLKGFRLSKYEVTFEQYDAYAKAMGQSKPSDAGWGRGKRPVINVSWHDAKGYIKWLNQQTKGGYRLPSEAEWEYAARAGTQSKYSWGNNIGKNKAICNGCGSRLYDMSTGSVGSFKANPWGLYDMHGNALEWVEDVWHDSYKGAPNDGSAWVSGGSLHVMRGGAWNVSPTRLRSANRVSVFTDYSYFYSGFRLAQDR